MFSGFCKKTAERCMWKSMKGRKNREPVGGGRHLAPWQKADDEEWGQGPQGILQRTPTSVPQFLTSQTLMWDCVFCIFSAPLKILDPLIPSVKSLPICNIKNVFYFPNKSQASTSALYGVTYVGFLYVMHCFKHFM